MTRQPLARGMAALAAALSLIALLRVASSASAHTLPQTPLALDAASVVFTKTVGANPAVCAATKAITLTAGGGSATYCYTIKNTGSLTLTRHTLVDARLGTVLSDFPFILEPGASAYLTQTAVITATTIHSATWTAFNPGPIDVASDSDTTTVNVIPSLPAIALAKTVGTNPAVCAATKTITLPVGGGSATFCYTIKNTGNLTLTRHTLIDDQLGLVLSNFPYTLGPGASAYFVQAAVITTTISSATWTAFNPGPVNSTSASAAATVTIITRVYLPLALRE